MGNIFAVLGEKENELPTTKNKEEKKNNPEMASQANKESPPRLESGEISETQLSGTQEETPKEAKGEANTGLSQKFPKPATRGRKTTKERRARETYKDKLQ